MFPRSVQHVPFWRGVLGTLCSCLHVVLGAQESLTGHVDCDLLVKVVSATFVLHKVIFSL